MISPSFKWQTWSEIETESKARFDAANNITMRECKIDDTAAFLDAASRDWMEFADAFLNESARALSLTRSALEQDAAVEMIHWRESSRQLGIYEVWRRGIIAPINFRRWSGKDGTHAEYMTTIQASAAIQP